MSYESHAMTEFRAAGWLDENGKFKDEMQHDICNHVLDLLKVFSEEGHSGSTALYTVNMFSKLALFKPLVPLTGEDWEWNDVSEYNGDRTVYQNKRASHVFKDETGAYDINGKVFWEWWTDPETGETSKSYFGSRDSRVYVTFPYTPTTVYEEAEPNRE